MKKSVLFLAVLLAACGSKPVPPAWQMNAHSAIGGFEEAYLRGDTRIADAEFGRARREMASTGRPDLAARAELVRCAVQVASLDLNDCPGFAALAQDAGPQERSYAAYLGGRTGEVNAALLPEQHRALAGGGPLAAVADPLARLVGAGVRMRTGKITPEEIKLAVDTASDQGWRRPLLAWLGVQEKRAVGAGDEAAVAAIRRRIDLVTAR